MAIGETIRDVVLRITGDGDDARRELERLALDLTEFGATEAEPEVDIDTEGARANLEELEREFSRIDGRDLTATAKVKLGKTMAEIAALQAELDRLDGQDVDIDINVKQDILDRMQLLGARAASFSDNLAKLESASDSAGGGLDRIGFNVGSLSGRLGTMLKILPALIPILVGVLAQIVAIGSSAIQAAGGLGALVVALGGALVSGVAIGGAAVARFIQTMERAGTPANRIVESVGKIGEALQELSKAADPILHAVADGMGGVFNVIKKVTPAFFELGKAAGKAVGWLIKALTSSDMANAISKLFELSGPALKPLVQILVRFGRILLNIANAAMPFLVSALQDLAKWLGEVVKATSNLKDTRGVIGGMIAHLQSWWALLKAVGGALGEIVRIASPFGKVLVDKLAEGAEKLREWLSSKEGTERVAQFFKEVLPLANQVAVVLGKIIVIGLQLGQLLAPVLEPIFRGFSQLLDIIIAVLEVLNKIPAPIRGLIGTAAALGLGFAKVKVAGELMAGAFLILLGALGALGGAFRSLAGVASAVFGAIADTIGDQIAMARERMVVSIGLMRDAAVAVWGAIRDAAGAIWGFIRTQITNQIDGAKEAVRTAVQLMSTAARAVWQGIREAAANIFGSIRDTIRNSIQSAREAVANSVRLMHTVATSMWNAIREAASNIFNAIRTAIANSFNAAREAVGNAVSTMRQIAADAWNEMRAKVADAMNEIRQVMVNAWNTIKAAVEAAVNGVVTIITSAGARFYNAGQALIQQLIDGFTSKISQLYDTVKGAVDKVTGLLPGSEPKDPSSPLRGLSKRGQAMINNLVRGINEAGPSLVKAVSEHLAAAAAAGPAGLSMAANAGAVGGSHAVHESVDALAPGPVDRMNGVSRGGGTTIEQLIVQAVTGGGSPDPTALLGQLNTLFRQRGLTG